jgi:SAM-dependent methyltransferase
MQEHMDDSFFKGSRSYSCHDDYDDDDDDEDFTVSYFCGVEAVESVHIDGVLVRTPLGLAFVICDIASCDRWNGYRSSDISVLLKERMSFITSILQSCSTTQHVEVDVSTGCYRQVQSEWFAGDSVRLLLITKQYRHVWRAAELLDSSRYIYPIDGLIFAPKRTSVHVSPPTFKWKPAYKMTLDLVVDLDDLALMAVDYDGVVSKLNFDTDKCGVENSLSMQDYKRADMQRGDFDSTKQVAEFLWNRLCHKWVCVRWRPDRTRPNSVDEVNFVLFEAAEHDRNIWEQMLAAHDHAEVEGLEDVDEKTAGTFGGYNGAIKDFVYCATAGRRIADLGCGPAKDIARWDAAGVSSVLAVDADESSIVATERLLVKKDALVSPCRGGVHIKDSKGRLTVLLAHGDLQNPTASLKDAILASAESMRRDLDTAYCNFAIHYFFDADLRYIFEHLKPGGKLVVTYMESEKVVAPIMTPALHVELDMENPERLMVTVASIGKTHCESRIDRASLISRCQEWGLICEGFLPFGSFASILGTPPMESTLYCCAVFQKAELDTFEEPEVDTREGFLTFDGAVATNFPVRVALQTDVSNKVRESLQKSPLLAAVIYGYDHASILDILEAFPAISPSDQLSAIQTYLKRDFVMGGIHHPACSDKPQILKVLLKARGDGALAIAVSAAFETAIENNAKIDVFELLLRQGATLESSATLVPKLGFLSRNVIDLFCEQGLISNICDRDTKKTSLMIACAAGATGCLESLLQHVSDPNDVDIYGSTAWDYTKLSSLSGTDCRYLLSSASISLVQRSAPETRFCGASASQMQFLDGKNRKLWNSDFDFSDNKFGLRIFTAALCAVRNSVTSKDLAESDEFETGLTQTGSGSIISILPWDLWEMVLAIYAAVTVEEETNSRRENRKAAREAYKDEPFDHHLMLEELYEEQQRNPPHEYDEYG